MAAGTTPSDRGWGPRTPRAGTPGTGTGGWVLFAGAVMVISGVLGILQGIAAVADDDVFRGLGTYVFEFDLTTWGWIHIVVGALVAAVGYGVLSFARWARWAGLVLVSIALIAHFVWLPYYPLWAVVAIALDLLVIWGLARWTDEPA